MRKFQDKHTIYHDLCHRSILREGEVVVICVGNGSGGSCHIDKRVLTCLQHQKAKKAPVKICRENLRRRSKDITHYVANTDERPGSVKLVSKKFGAPKN